MGRAESRGGPNKAVVGFVHTFFGNFMRMSGCTLQVGGGAPEANKGGVVF